MCAAAVALREAETNGSPSPGGESDAGVPRRVVEETLRFETQAFGSSSPSLAISHTKVDTTLTTLAFFQGQ